MPSGSIAPIGAELKYPNGRVKIRTTKGWPWKARVVMEKKIGRKLQGKEKVYHLDGDLSNDQPSNLVIETPRQRRSYLCNQCGRRFTATHRASRQKFKGRYIPVKYCSRKCFADSIRGKPFSGVAGDRTGKKQPRESVIRATIARRAKGFKWTEPRRQAAFARRGEGHPMWKGGITSLIKRIRVSHRYREWRTMVFLRDDFTCKVCGQRGGNLHAHHTPKTLSILISEALQYIPLLNPLDAIGLYSPIWDLKNAQTLCQKCHQQEHRGKRKGS